MQSMVHVTVTSPSGDVLLMDSFPRIGLVAEVKKRMLRELDKVFVFLYGTEELTEASIVNEDSIVLGAVVQQLSDDECQAILQKLTRMRDRDLTVLHLSTMSGPAVYLRGFDPLHGLSLLALYDDEVIDVALEILRHMCTALRWCGDMENPPVRAIAPVKDRRKFMLKLLAADIPGYGLGVASARLRDNDDFVVVGVSQSGETLRFASDRLRGNKRIVMAAVKKNWRALQFASKELRDDREVVAVAASQSSEAFHFASDRLRHPGGAAIETPRKRPRCGSNSGSESSRELALKTQRKG